MHSACDTESRSLQDPFPFAQSVRPTQADAGSQDPESSSLTYPFFGNSGFPQLGGERLHTQLQVPGKNVIDLDRIERGLDTRTTV